LLVSKDLRDEHEARVHIDLEDELFLHFDAASAYVSIDALRAVFDKVKREKDRFV
jgi:hypothetical protein